MADRRVSVTINADIGPYSRGLATASAETRVFARELRSADTDVNHLGSTFRSSGNDIDRYSGRLRLLGDALAILGPAAVPISAAVVPAVAGLANQLGFTALGAGTAVLAFHGVGDALKALNDYQLEPTAAHLAKLNETMQQLGPAGRDFVRELDSLGPMLHRLQSSAQAGLFPGLTDAIETIATRAPELQRIVSTVASTLGDLSAEAGDALAGPEWDDFFQMLQTEARPVLTDMGRAIGSIVHGLAEMSQAFLPLSNDFGAGLARMAAGFDRWASGLSQSEGFEHFLDYVRTVGPKVLDLLGSLADMFVQIAQAAAPIGGPVLEALTAIAKAIAAIADSDLGTPIFGAIAAMSAYRLALLGVEKVQNSAFGTAAMNQRFGGIRTNLRGLTSDLNVVATTWATAGARSQRESERLRASTARLGTAAVGVGKTAAVLGGVGLVATGTADKLGLTNTATLALAGSLAGPLGAGLLGTVGAMMDASHAAAGLHDALQGLNNETEVSKLASDIATAQRKLDDLSHTSGVGDFFSDQFTRLGGLLHGDFFGADSNSNQKFQDQIDAAKKRLAELKYEAGQAYSEATSSTDAATAATQRYTTSIEVLQSRLQKRSAYGAYLQSLIDTRKAIEDNGRAFQRNGKLIDETNPKMVASYNQLTSLANSMQQRLAQLSGPAQAAAMKHMRQQFVNLAVDMGMGRAAADRLANKLLHLDQIKPSPKVRVDDAQAKARLAAIRRELADVNNTVARPQVRVGFSMGNLASFTNRAASAAAAAVAAAVAGRSALGGPVPKDGGPYADRFPYLLAPGEYVVSNRAGQADRYRPLLDLMNAGRLAGGGPVPQIGTAVSSGGLPMIGTATSATFGLAQAIRELRHYLDSHEKLSKAERARLEKKLDRLTGLQDALKDFSVKDLLPTKDPTNPIWAGVRSELADLQKAVKAAGGRWTGAMQDDAHGLLAHALKLDQLNRSQEKLNATVEAQQQAYDDLKQKMADFGDQVASNFRTDLFGGETPASAQSILDVLTSDTNRASQFYDAFNTLSSRGLDTSILQELGSKGDLASAQNLAQNATASQIAQINAAVGGRSQMLDLLGKSAGFDAYGKALSDQKVVLDASLAAQQANVAAVNAQTHALEVGFAEVKAEVRSLNGSVGKIAGQLQHAGRH